jgi:outer membrane immunogenic protein
VKTKLSIVAATTMGITATCSVQAADLSSAHVYKATPSTAVATPGWTGFYAGLNAGYGWSADSTSITGIDPNAAATQAAGSIPTSLSPKINGFVGGGQLGYNSQFGQYVAGVETDIDYSDMRGTGAFAIGAVAPNPALTTSESNKLNWFGTSRARFGWLFNPSTLVFATAGVAYGGARASTNVVVPGSCPGGNAFCSSGSGSKTLVGWTVGGGLESMIAANWNAKIEYLYFDLGSISDQIISPNVGAFTNPLLMANSKFNGSIVRVGINYKFN